ncbi:NACHT domain-containing protein [Microtetraspora glauca]|uniref:AAA+ ATPase domain-containing protein n=1 Tax=Microtetraspora glauca TaxID=1996 RepID=A0ABV3GS93_MICGL
MFNYRDAVNLLGGASFLSGLLDKMSAVALLGLGAIDLIDARAEVVKLGDGLIRGLRDRVKRLARYDRTERLVAAHAVVVITAYFEALRELNILPRDDLTRDDQERMLGQDPMAHWVEQLIIAELPTPTPQHPHEDVLTELNQCYQKFSFGLLDLVSGLAIWDEWDDTRRARVRREVSKSLPHQACRRYEELFRRLAAEFPEVACWANLIEHQATRAKVQHLRQGLAGLEEQLRKIGSGREPSDRLAALVQANRAALDRPIISATDVPQGMTIPPLRLAYINPGFRVLSPEHYRHPADERSWDTLPLRNDLNEFLSGHLTLPQAVRAPLLILGQPGAGKSVLTKMLAARLPSGDFLPIRVELRNVPADSSVLAQIEHAIRDALDEPVSWPELVQAAQGALPVVMMDGFDELLQATGVTQTDYLEKVAEFQQRQAERGRALVVVVTSRTAVADRARVPDDAVVLRLESFNEEQVWQWVTVWNGANHGYFNERRLAPLSIEEVLAVPDLAGQPLLLLMLALYDADANELRRVHNTLDEAELYEQLLLRFAEREVRKTREGISDADLLPAIEQEFLRLSVTAFAMFNRGRQWVTEDDLDEDLNALLCQPSEVRRPDGFRRKLTSAEGVIGGFFFVHRAQALRDEQRLKTYEFLHATFSEYLIARLVARELADLAAELAAAGSRTRPARPDDAFLHALLSFAVLTVRAPIVGFLRYGISYRIPEDRRTLLRRYLCELFTNSLYARPSSSYDAYRPMPATVPARLAAYSSNLLLCILATDRPISGTELFALNNAGVANEHWQGIAGLWHSQLTGEEWGSLIRAVRVHRSLQDNVRVMTVQLNRGDAFKVAELPPFIWPISLRYDSKWPFESSDRAGDYDLAISQDHELAVWPREISFRDDHLLANLFVNLLPYAKNLGVGLSANYLSSEVGAVVPAFELLTLLLEPCSDTDRRMRIYMRALSAAESFGAIESGGRYGDFVVKQLDEDCDKLPAQEILNFLDRWAINANKSRIQWNGIRRILGRLGDRADLDVARHHEIIVKVEEMFTRISEGEGKGDSDQDSGTSRE